MTVLNNNLLLGADAAASGYQISRSLRFNSSDSAYLSRTPSVAGNRKTWTWAGWVKRGVLTNSTLMGVSGTADDTNYLRLHFNGDKLYLGGGVTNFRATTALYRDPSAWYHIVVALDTTQATTSNRVKLYVNGVEITTFDISNAPALNADLAFNTTTQHQIGAVGSTVYLDGYLADIHFIDGQALTPSSFGEFDVNGVWQPKAYSGTYGTNGFRLPFSNPASTTTIAQDSSGNNNHWTANNLSVTAGVGNDSLVDSPTNYGTDTGAGGEVRGNYATLNPLDQYSTITLTNGNLEVKVNEANWRSVRANSGMSTGKWYWEVTLDANIGYHMHGIGLASAALTTYPGNTANSWSLYYGGGALLGGNSTGTTSAYTANQVIGFAFNADTGRLDLYQNGTLQSGYFTLPSGNTYFPMLGIYGANVGVATFNAGQRPFAYAAPSGYKALCSTNLPTPTILKGSSVMDVKLYTGNTTGQTISGLGFNPDFVWFKSRGAAYSHQLYDSVRGGTASLSSNDTTAETTRSGAITSFNSDGFTIGNEGGINDTSIAMAAWCWDAGSSTVANTAGTITSQVRANPSAGFSVVTYTGTGVASATVGHGLGVAPQFLIFKQRGTVNNWIVVHKDIDNPWNNYSMCLNTTGGRIGTQGTFDNVAPTSSLLSLSATGTPNTNTNTATYVAYCFAPVAGYSAFGSYTGNGSATDGPFVYTGFRPRWILIKQTTAASTTNWIILDSYRPGYNVADGILYASTADAEAASATADFTSNGFKIRISTGTTNASNGTYVYAAFAENPFSIARAR